MTDSRFGPPRWGPPSNDNVRPDPIQGRRLVFIDVEASSLGPDGYPIEIAYRTEDGIGEGFLIRPAEGWDDWSYGSEQIHGISREMLERDGLEAEYVARRMAALLTEYVGVSDNPQFDGMWLRELYAMADIEQVIHLVDVHEVWASACRPLLRRVMAMKGTPLWQRQVDDMRLTAKRLIGEATTAAERVPRVLHRAQQDADLMWRVWLEIRRLVAEELGERSS